MFHIVKVFLPACVEGSFCFTKAFLVAVTTCCAVLYRALKIKRVDRIFSISKLVTNCSHRFEKLYDFVISYTSLQFF